MTVRSRLHGLYRRARRGVPRAASRSVAASLALLIAGCDDASSDTSSVRVAPDGGREADAPFDGPRSGGDGSDAGAAVSTGGAVDAGTEGVDAGERRADAATDGGVVVRDARGDAVRDAAV